MFSLNRAYVPLFGRWPDVPRRYNPNRGTPEGQGTLWPSPLPTPLLPLLPVEGGIQRRISPVMQMEPLGVARDDLAVDLTVLIRRLVADGAFDLQGVQVVPPEAGPPAPLSRRYGRTGKEGQDLEAADQA
jgi:hypothetical protein